MKPVSPTRSTRGVAGAGVERCAAIPTGSASSRPHTNKSARFIGPCDPVIVTNLSELHRLPVLGHHEGPSQLAMDSRAQRGHGGWLAMHDEGLSWRSRETAQPAHDLVRVRVGGHRLEVLDPRGDRHPLAVDLD